MNMHYLRGSLSIMKQSVKVAMTRSLMKLRLWVYRSLHHGYSKVLFPNFARWADFMAGSEVPAEERDAIDNELDEVTEYVFEVIQNSNFGQEVHESFMDLAVGTGCLSV